MSLGHELNDDDDEQLNVRQTFKKIKLKYCPRTKNCKNCVGKNKSAGLLNIQAVLTCGAVSNANDGYASSFAAPESSDLTSRRVGEPIGRAYGTLFSRLTGFGDSSARFGSCRLIPPIVIATQLTSIHIHSVKLRLYGTDGRTDAGNRIWCILALICDT